MSKRKPKRKSASQNVKEQAENVKVQAKTSKRELKRQSASRNVKALIHVPLTHLLEANLPTATQIHT